MIVGGLILIEGRIRYGRGREARGRVEVDLPTTCTNHNAASDTAKEMQRLHQPHQPHRPHRPPDHADHGEYSHRQNMHHTQHAARGTVSVSSQRYRCLLTAVPPSSRADSLVSSPRPRDEISRLSKIATAIADPVQTTAARQRRSCFRTRVSGNPHGPTTTTTATGKKGVISRERESLLESRVAA